MAANATSERGATRVPRRAREYYKAVAVVEGRFFSIYDGTTEYQLHQESHNPRGIWVCPDLFSMVQHTRRSLPRRSRLLEAPRATIRLLGWNADGSMPSAPEPVSLTYVEQHCFSLLRFDSGTHTCS
jgi:hypothetical protein